MTMKKMMLAVSMLVAMLSLVGCFDLEIKDNVDYPTGKYQKVLAKIAQIHADYPNRKGPVNRVNFMVYVGEERKLISFSIPKSMVSTIADLGKDAGKGKDIKEYSEALDNFDIEKLKDLDKLGPGLLIEVEVTDKKEYVHLLIWLD